MFRKTLSVVFVWAVIATACGSDADKSNAAVDIEVNNATSPDDADAGGDTDAGDEFDAAANNALPQGCGFVGFDPATSYAEQSDTGLQIGASTSASADGLRDELFFVHRTADPQVGTLALQGNFADCTNCLAIQTGCSEAGCVATYMAQSGSVELLELGDEAHMRISDLRLAPVLIDDQGETTVQDGDAFCIDTLEFAAPVEVDPCAGWPEPSLADVNCGEAPLTVTFNATGFQAEMDDFSFISIDFGDGETYYSTTDALTSHTFAAGEYDVSIEAVGYVDDVRVTLNTPERIRAY